MYLCPECQTYYHGAAAPEDCLLDGLPLVEQVEPPAAADVRANLERLGTAVDRYELVAFLGAGGMGAVFIARRLAPIDLTPMLLYGALKLLAPGEPFDTSEQFEREAKSLLDVRHDNIARLQDWGQAPAGGYYLVTELVRGPSLAQLIRRRQRLEPSEVATIGQQILSGVDAVHASGIVHRDIKPSNVMLARQADGQLQAKLIDFGIAARRADAAPGRAPGPCLGTPAYMAPEQFHGQSNERSDLYAVGLCLYEMLAGKRPFAGSDCEELRRQHAEAPVPPVLDHPAGGSQIEVLEGFIRVLLNKNPAERPPSAQAALAWLTALAPRTAPSGTVGGSGWSPPPRAERRPPPAANLPPTLPPSNEALSDSEPAPRAPELKATPARAPAMPRWTWSGTLRRATPFAAALAVAAGAAIVLRGACTPSSGFGPTNPKPPDPMDQLAKSTPVPAAPKDERRPEDTAPTAAPDGLIPPQGPPARAPEPSLLEAGPNPEISGSAAPDTAEPSRVLGTSEGQPGTAVPPGKRRKCTREIELRTRNYQPRLTCYLPGAREVAPVGLGHFVAKVPCDLQRLEVSAVGGGRRVTVALDRGSGPYLLEL